jgi:two-component system CheB/CheR fusion protein
VDVADTGEGIDPDLLPHVFDDFEQGGAHVTREFGGLGLGLAITKGLVRQHGGSIEAHSGGRGKGATFRVTLPLRPVGDVAESPTVTAAELTHEPQRNRPLDVLLVEDHADTAKVMRRLLTREGHRVQLAGTLADALDAARARTFDLLISDLGLPDGSGADLLRTLRDEGRDPPAVALSGYGQERDIERTREVGFAAHLTKPIDLDLLNSAIARVARTSAGRARDANSPT